MNKENYTSLELSKKLLGNGCELLSSFGWFKYPDETWRVLVGGSTPAYDLLWDVCIKYAKEFFYKDETSEVESEYYLGMPVWREHTINILYLLQHSKKQDAEDYIWEHCLFNPKNQ